MVLSTIASSKQLFLLLLLRFPSSVFSAFPNQNTVQCLLQANRQDCALFTYCCERNCGNGGSHRCLAFMGSIELAQSGCYCSSSPSPQWPLPLLPLPFSSPRPFLGTGRLSKWDNFGRKADFVGGVFLLFMLDLLLLSFTL
uniref:Uncharacterized protein n=1 Tax=Globodera rostochiensis TaxID=31243 RepID=A0A914H7Q0_GLORO